MIKVDKGHVEFDNSENNVPAELALLIHIMHKEFPKTLRDAMEAEDKLYHKIKEGK